MRALAHRSMFVFLYYLPFLIICSIIYYFSSISHPPIPQFMLFPNSDKILHAIAFSVVGTAAAFGATLRRRIFDYYAYLEAWILAVLYAAFDEIHQSFTPYRSPSSADWVADALGAAFGIVLYFLVIYYLKRFIKGNH